MIKRNLLDSLRTHLNSKEISLITGPRQSGKTTIMKELKRILDSKGENTLFLNLDYESDKRYFESQDVFLNKIRLEISNKSKTGFVFIDEMQRKENAGLFLKGIYDMDTGYKFIVSGSGSLELKEKIHESLAGRKRMFELNTLSFEEFANFKTNYKYEGYLQDFFVLEPNKTFLLLEEYMNFGGYPRIALEESLKEKTMLIDEIYRSYLEKDISYLLKVGKAEAFSKMIKLLSAQISSLLNYSDLASKSGISVITLKEYLWYARLTFIIRELSPYFGNYPKEIVKSPIIYFNDLGLRNYMLGLFGNIIKPLTSGMIFQNFIHNILSEKIRYSSATLHFWRTLDKAEVDFVINTSQSLIPIEVKYSSFKKNEITRSLHSFIQKYEPPTAYVVNLSYSSEQVVGKTKVKFIPFYKLLPLEI